VPRYAPAHSYRPGYIKRTYFVSLFPDEPLVTAAIAGIAALFSREVAIRQRLVTRATNAAPESSSSQSSGCT